MDKLQCRGKSHSERELRRFRAVGRTEITGSGARPDRYQPPQGFEIILNIDDPTAAERLSSRWLKEGW